MSKNRQATIYRYSLDMDSGVILRDSYLQKREGLVLELEENQQKAYAEVAPLQGFSIETLKQAQEQLQQVTEKWLAGQEVNESSLFPSVAFAWSIAQLQLKQQLPERYSEKVAPLCTGDPDELFERFLQMPTPRVGKVKVGLYEPIRDAMLVNLLLETVPDLTLRLDANRQWSLAKAEKFAQQLTPYAKSRIDFIEEPCVDKETSLQFKQNTQLPIAWDESLQQAVRDDALDASWITNADALVVKPTLIGEIACCRKIAELTQRHQMQLVFSSSLETSLGLSLIARLAECFGHAHPVSGLDTLSMYRQQLHHAWETAPQPIVSLESCDIIFQS